MSPMPATPEAQKKLSIDPSALVPSQNIKGKNSDSGFMP